MSRYFNISSTIVLLAALALGTVGCAGKKASPLEIEQQAFDDMRAEIQSVISDPERAAEAVALISAIQQSFAATQKDIAARQAKLRTLNADYDASRADIEAQFEQVVLDIKLNQENVSEIHRQLMSILTTDEWEALEKARSDAMDAAIQSIQSI
jgi:hypothetical protein